MIEVEAAELEAIPKDGANKDGFIFVEADRSMLVGEHLGETAKKTMAIVEQALGGVLFIDEAYSLVQPGGRDMFGREAVDTLIKAMEDHRDKLIVILAGYSEEMTGFIDANPGFKSRVPLSFTFEDYTCPQLVELAGHMAGKTGITFGDGLLSASRRLDASGQSQAQQVLKKTIKVYTQCCEDDEPDCVPSRDNGNGRTVRNILESARRSMAGRVMGAADEAAVDYLGGFKDKRQEIVRQTEEGNLDKVAVKALHDKLNKEVDEGSVLGGRPPASLPGLLESLRALDSSDFEDALEERALNVLRVGLQELRDELGDSEEDQVRFNELDAKIAGLKTWVLAVKALDSETEDEDGLTEEDRFFKLLDEKEHEQAADMMQGVAEDRGTEEKPPFEPVGRLAMPKCGVDPGASSRSLERIRYTGPDAKAERDARCKTFEASDCENHSLCKLPEVTEEAKIFAEIMDLQGLEKVKRKVGDLYLSAQFSDLRFCAGEPDIGAQSFHMTFLGNPGTGKTEVGRKIGRLLTHMGIVKKKSLMDKVKDAAAAAANALGLGGKDKEADTVPFHEVSRADLVAEYVGQTAPKVKKAVEKAMGGVLFVDEAYSIVKGDRDKFGNEAVDTLIKEMEDKRDSVIVVMAGYEKEMTHFLDANPGFKSRVPFSFLFDDYKCSELAYIGEKMYQKRDLHLTGGGKKAFERLVEFSTGCCESDVCETRRDSGNGRAVRNILESSLRHIAARVTKEIKEEPVPKKDWTSEKRAQMKRSMSQATTADMLAVYHDMVMSQLKGSCRANGMLEQFGKEVAHFAKGVAKTPLAAKRFSLHRSKTTMKPDNLRGILLQIQHLARDAADDAFLARLPLTDREGQPTEAGALKQLAEQCVAHRQTLFANLHNLVKGICNSEEAKGSAIMTLLGEMDGADEKAIKEYVSPLQSLQQDAEMGLDLLRAGRPTTGGDGSTAAVVDAPMPSGLLAKRDVCRTELDTHLALHQTCVPFQDLSNLR